MAVTRTARLGLVLWSDDDDTLGTFREDLVESFAAIEAKAALRTELDAEAAARLGADNALDLAKLAKAGGTVSGNLDVTGALRPNGGIAPIDGTLEVTGAIAATGILSGSRVDVTGQATIGGALDHDGALVGFYGATPIARPGATAELKAALAGLGLLTDGGATPLDLDGGALTTGPATHNGALTVGAFATTLGGALTVAGALIANGGISAADGTLELAGNVAVATTLTEAGERVATRAYVDTAVGNSSTTTSGNLNDHKNDTTDSHLASSIGYAGSTNLAATNVEAALDELDAEKLALAGGTITGALTVTGALTADGGLVLNAGDDVTIAATTGSRIGQAGSRIAFYGATPVLRPGTYSVDASTVTSRSLAAYTADVESAAYATEPAALADAAARADLNALRIAVENLRAYVEDLGGLTAANTRDLITLGLFG